LLRRWVIADPLAGQNQFHGWLDEKAPDVQLSFAGGHESGDDGLGLEISLLLRLGVVEITSIAVITAARVLPAFQHCRVGDSRRREVAACRGIPRDHLCWIP
jgi:hypothetical protein